MLSSVPLRVLQGTEPSLLGGVPTTSRLLPSAAIVLSRLHLGDSAGLSLLLSILCQDEAAAARTSDLPGLSGEGQAQDSRLREAPPLLPAPPGLQHQASWLLLSFLSCSSSQPGVEVPPEFGSCLTDSTLPIPLCPSLHPWGGS